jgi:hypothetical protein
MLKSLTITDINNGEFTYNGVDYFMDVKNFRKSVVEDTGLVEVEIVDSDVYIGSPFKIVKHNATLDNINFVHCERFILNNKHLWKILQP